MKPYRKTDSYTLYLDDAWEVLDSLAENSIDAIVTDPPYEIGFMNKGWDNTGVAFDKQTWQKALRVLKPGGHLLAFNHSRTFHRMAVSIEDAGFEIRDTIMWLYGSGFPKSHDISKAIDKGQGENRDRQLRFTEWMRSTGLTQNKCAEIIKDFAKNEETAKAMAQHYYSDKQQPAIPVADIFDQIKKHLKCEVPEEIERLVAERTGIEWTAYKNREVVGQRIVPEGHSFASERFEKSTKSIETNITTAATEEAKQWEGWGTALKPAYEPILLARKPIPTTVADNVLQYGTGAINIDGCRVNFVSEEDKKESTTKNQHADFGTKPITNNNVYGDYSMIQPKNFNPPGRFPANVIHDGSEEVTQGFPETVSTPRTLTIGGTTGIGISTNFQRGSETSDYNDSGSASRFFYTAKTSKKDRDDGLDTFDTLEMRGGGGRVSDGYDNNDEDEQRLKEAARKYGAVKTAKRNIHPTVKPTDLMQYLIRLIAAPNATILDIFMGSGSTGKAAMIENAERDSNYHFIGIDRTAEYLPIAEARIEFGLHYKTEKPKADGVVHKDQIDIFTLL